MIEIAIALLIAGVSYALQYIFGRMQFWREKRKYIQQNSGYVEQLERMDAEYHPEKVDVEMALKCKEYLRQVFPGGINERTQNMSKEELASLFEEMAKEWKRLFAGCGVNKIFTIEASGIGIACIVAQYFDVPVVFAKKTQTKNIAGEVYTTKVESFTHGRVYDIIVSKEFLGPGDKVLIIDDFLANGKALEGLAALVRDSGAELVGAGIVIEKGFQVGGDLIRSEGIRLESLAIVDSMDEETQTIVFRDDE